jgi:hypothetical protein
MASSGLYHDLRSLRLDFYQDFIIFRIVKHLNDVLDILLGAGSVKDPTNSRLPPGKSIKPTKLREKANTRSEARKATKVTPLNKYLIQTSHMTSLRKLSKTTPTGKPSARRRAKPMT